MPSNDTPKKIFLKGSPSYREAAATATVTPGMLVEAVAGGNAAPHGTAGGPGAPAFARENEIIGNGIDVDYAAGDNVLYGVSRSGDEVYGWIADGENVAAGDYLQSDGAGAFEAWVAGSAGTTLPGHALVKAKEDVDNSAGGAPARIKLEVL